jgi:ribosomal-protein-alanine N-acetyltransferase
LSQAHAAGAVTVLLEVRESNVAARRLYRKLGFTEHGRRSNYYLQPAEDALLLSVTKWLEAE